MRRQLGFTLIEMVVTVAVMAIGLGVAMPAVARLVTSGRVITGMHLMSASLASARMAAISLPAPTVVCPITPPRLRCRRDGVWDRGWMVFRDPRHMGQPEGRADILQVVERAPSPLRLRSSVARRLIRFQPDGRAAGSNVVIRLCTGGELNAVVAVNNVGRVRSSRAAGRSDCAAAIAASRREQDPETP
ncbi:GspH/FimT family pseudopilin [Luteimonas aquatica]|uniref:GspH/FimT family pseudopilin n=1 Tax=Luteimonas aquatica TaxID=450364 RepID=UPI0024122D21|nr:GspH/FimT family pseudopilin [Luteimonas aquatica]